MLYINDIFGIAEDDSFISYADDSTVFSNGKTWQDASDKKNYKLEILYSWFYENHLVLNISKTVYLLFSNHVDTLPLNIDLQISKPNRVTSAKYQGITFDQYMRWNFHGQNIIKRSRYLLFVFAKLKNILNINSLLT